MTVKMKKKREEIVEKLLKEMFLAFRSMRPEGSSDHGKDHKHGSAHKFGGPFRGFGPFGKHKFSHGHRDLLFCLMKEKEGINVKEIAESLSITSGAVTQMVDRAIEVGIVTREEDPNDRRSQIIKLSEKARSKIQKFRQLFVKKAEAKLVGLTDEEITQLTSLLAKINAAKEAGSDE